MFSVNELYSHTPWLIPEIEEEVFEFVKKYSNRVHLKSSDIIFGHQNTGDIKNKDSVILVEKGLLCQAIHTDDVNKPMAITIILPKRMLNYCGYLGMAVTSETVYALRESDVYVISIKVLEHHLEQNYRIKEAIKTYCVKCIASDYETFACMFTKMTEKRLATFFLSLARSIGVKEDNEFSYIPIKLSYQELSYLMYSTTKTIERIMPLWKKMGIIICCCNGVKLNVRELNILKNKYK
ncbi:Crp/Fnr family transcriptional regulator [Shewanella fodinae]|uniref:Crp/Fnr family transcriptional regulator n=1 Tax=Shewanella fodinae TaxID=552357 RepID=UPI00167BB7B2|nr:helix-turn-helix domain-containing protein [Shewanella fodinae]MCL2908339.1 helix-turn-helix domain-containing protein [Shewanella fodinae]GGZ15592.1 hypothetical protein GCM10007169_34980 [Shewanella fodinae]